MKLYLVRHGEALDKSIDPERGLSDRGKRDAGKVGHYLGAREDAKNVAEVRSSTKARAVQTAGILGSELGSHVKKRSLSGLAPNDPVEPVADEMERLADDIMLVGHLPFLPTLAARLLAGARPDESMVFPTAGVLILERDADGVWNVVKQIDPGSLPG